MLVAREVSVDVGLEDCGHAFASGYGGCIFLDVGRTERSALSQLEAAVMLSQVFRVWHVFLPEWCASWAALPRVAGSCIACWVEDWSDTFHPLGESTAPPLGALLVMLQKSGRIGRSGLRTMLGRPQFTEQSSNGR